MPLWLDLLRTPMAAPETDDLRVMRRTFQFLCVTSAVSVLAISPLVRLFGRPASFVVAAILATTALHTALYVFRKNRADNDFLFAAKSSDEAGVMSNRRPGVNAIPTATLQIVSDYVNVMVAAILLFWIGTDLAARILSPFWEMAASLVPPISWSMAYLAFLAVMYSAALWLQRVVDRRSGEPS